MILASCMFHAPAQMRRVLDMLVVQLVVDHASHQLMWVNIREISKHLHQCR